jgi:GAF domain-containing protein
VFTDRLLREIEKRLAHLPEDDRAAALDAVREEIARERRRDAPPGTIEAERERRVEAESLRAVMEAITRPAQLDDTIAEVLKQLSRLVVFDSCSLALLDPDGRFRIIAGRGFPEDAQVVGLRFRDALSDEIRQSAWPITLPDASADERFVQLEGTGTIRSWAGVPLLVEGETIGVLCLDRTRLDPFAEEDLHRARAVAFSAAAAIRKAQLHEKVRRYAELLERVLRVDQAVFAEAPPPEVARLLVEGARQIGRYPAGMLALADSGTVVAGDGVFAPLIDGKAPPELLVPMTGRLEAERVSALGQALGVPLPKEGIYLVPLLVDDRHVGTLSLLDPDGQTPDDRLMDAYASRAAAAYVHALRGRS